MAAHGGASPGEEDGRRVVEEDADAEQRCELVDDAQDVLVSEQRLREQRVGGGHAVGTPRHRGLVLRECRVAEDVPADEHRQELILSKSKETRRS